jgi:hypothetical protein
VTGALDTMDEDLEAAEMHHGLKAALIRRPADAPIEIPTPALALGILVANSAHSNDHSGENSAQ